MLIDFDDPSTFPTCLSNWDEGFDKIIREHVNIEEFLEWWEIENKLKDLHIDEMSIVQNYLKENLNVEVAVCHCTRILDELTYRKNGIVVSGGRNSSEEQKLISLLKMINLSTDMIDEVMDHVYQYWNRDKELRTESIHFFINKNRAYEDPQINYFAVSLGGEILRWAIASVGSELYKEEPYKRLWIMGKPSVIKFKCKLSDIDEKSQSMLIAAIVKYFVVTKIFKKTYKFELTGMTKRSVPPENIMCIDEIENFIQIQEQYEQFNGFYDELK